MPPLPPRRPSPFGAMPQLPPPGGLPPGGPPPGMAPPSAPGRPTPVGAGGSPVPQMAMEQMRGALLRRMQGSPGQSVMPPPPGGMSGSPIPNGSPPPPGDPGRPGMPSSPIPSGPPPPPGDPGMPGMSPQGGMGGFSQAPQLSQPDAASVLKNLMATRNSRRVLGGGPGAAGF